MNEKKLEEIFDLLISNKDFSLKLFVPPEGNESKYVYIDVKGLTIYVNYLLPRESPESVLPAILFALAHLNFGTYLYETNEPESLDYYIYSRVLKRLGFEIIFDSICVDKFGYGYDESNFEEYFKFYYSKLPGGIKCEIKELSNNFGRPYELKTNSDESGDSQNDSDSSPDSQNGEGSSPKVQEAGDLSWKDVLKQVSDQIKNDSDNFSESSSDSSNESQGDSSESDSESNQSDNDDSSQSASNFGTGIETNLDAEDLYLYSLLREFFTLVMDRGKKFKLDSMKHFNRKSRGNTNLIYSSISKKVLKSRDKWGILVDVSGSMPNKALCSILRIFSDDFGSIVDPKSVVVTWNTTKCQEFLISEIPDNFYSNGGTDLTRGVKYLEGLNCKKIMVYSDFEDWDCRVLNEELIKAKSNGISVYCFSPCVSNEAKSKGPLLSSYNLEFSEVWRRVTRIKAPQG